MTINHYRLIFFRIQLICISFLSFSVLRPASFSASSVLCTLVSSQNFIFVRRTVESVWLFLCDFWKSIPNRNSSVKIHYLCFFFIIFHPQYSIVMMNIYHTLSLSLFIVFGSSRNKQINLNWLTHQTSWCSSIRSFKSWFSNKVAWWPFLTK